MFIQKKYFPLLLLTVASGCNNHTKTAAAKAIEPAKKQDTTLRNPPVKETTTLIVDTAEVLSAFRELAKTDRFFKEMSLNRDGSEGEATDDERPVLIGDLNGDGLYDALMPFMLVGRGGGNNWTAQTAVFINNGKKLEYKFTYDRGGDMADTVLDFTTINDGVITGVVAVNNFTKKEIEKQKYIYKNGNLILQK